MFLDKVEIESFSTCQFKWVENAKIGDTSFAWRFALLDKKDVLIIAANITMFCCLLASEKNHRGVSESHAFESISFVYFPLS